MQAGFDQLVGLTVQHLDGAEGRITAVASDGRLEIAFFSGHTTVQSIRHLNFEREPLLRVILHNDVGLDLRLSDHELQGLLTSLTAWAAQAELTPFNEIFIREIERRQAVRLEEDRKKANDALELRRHKEEQLRLRRLAEEHAAEARRRRLEQEQKQAHQRKRMREDNERRRQDLVAAEAKEAERQRLAKEHVLEGQRQREALRQKQVEGFRNELRSVFAVNFLGADDFFLAKAGDMFSQEDFEAEKIAFVQSWMAEHLPRKKEDSPTKVDREQAAAIGAVQGNVQVVARAGSGKTLVLVNRAFFLQKHCAVPPDAMLLLAFNRAAAIEIRRRLLSALAPGADAEVTVEATERHKSRMGRKIDPRDIEEAAVSAVAERLSIQLPLVMTFHALAFALAPPRGNLLYDEDKHTQTLSKVVQRILDDHLRSSQYFERMRALMLSHFREGWESIIAGGYHMSREDMLAYRRTLSGRSLGDHPVKSYGEKLIANFLFEHDVPYVYEQVHRWGGRNYRPDFTIYLDGRREIIVEYFGLAGDPRYDAMSEAKRQYWRNRPGDQLLEYTPADISVAGGIHFLERLQRDLEHAGMRCNRLTEDEIWAKVQDRAVGRFSAAVKTFIGRCRKLGWSPQDLHERVRAHQPLSTVEPRFLDFAQDLYGAYLERLAATGEDDFDGLLQRAAAAVRSGKTDFARGSARGSLKRLRYVSVDEFQDFSELFYQLLRSIRERNPAVEVFCVGDDWQAINGFAGSDLKFFSNFRDYFGPSKRLLLATNYRSTKRIVQAGNALMKGLGEPSRASTLDNGEVLVAALEELRPTDFERKRHWHDSITPAVLRLVHEALLSDQRVVLLNRRNWLPWHVAAGEEDPRALGSFQRAVRAFLPQGSRRKIEVSNAHQFKGREREVVVILDGIDRAYPLIHPDWVFCRVFGDSVEKIIEDERRLFYVALTRAVHRLIIITEEETMSPFLFAVRVQLGLTRLNWDDYPPVPSLAGRLVVRIGNQVTADRRATQDIIAQLRGAGYNWQTVGWPCWEKTFAKGGFSVENLKQEVWSSRADGVEVRIEHEDGRQLGLYMINDGRWRCVTDKLSELLTNDYGYGVEQRLDDNGKVESMVATGRARKE